MKVLNTLTEAELAERLDEVLDRASQGEEFAIERNGDVFAVIRPPIAVSGTTLRDLAREFARIPPLDDDFAADVEPFRVNQRPAKIPERHD